MNIADMTSGQKEEWVKSFMKGQYLRGWKDMIIAGHPTVPRESHWGSAMPYIAELFIIAEKSLQESK